MGAIGCDRPKGMTDKAFLEGLYTSVHVLATGRKDGVIYAAARKRDTFDEGEMAGEVFALVMPYWQSRGEFVVKEQDETMGPCDARCPAKVLALLTETDDEYANEWREKCREHLARDYADRERAKKVVEGTVIRTAETLDFSRGFGSFNEFRYTGRASRFVALRDGLAVGTVSLGGDWKSRDYEVVS